MDEKSLKGLKKLARGQQIKYSLIFLAIVGFTFFLYWIYHTKTGGKFTDPSGIFFVIMLMVPFIFKVHRRIFERSWRGEVKRVKDPDSSERSSYLSKSYALPFLMKNKGLDVRVVTVATTTLGNRDIILVGDEVGLGDSYYRVGDKVQKFPGLKYPVNYTTDRPEVFCPVCGSFNRLDEDKCYLCKHALVDPERKRIVPEKIEME